MLPNRQLPDNTLLRLYTNENSAKICFIDKCFCVENMVLFGTFLTPTNQVWGLFLSFCNSKQAIIQQRCQTFAHA